MSGIGIVLENQTRQRKIVEPEVKGTIKASENITATIFGQAGIDSKPLSGDAFAFIEKGTRGGKTVIGFLDTQNASETQDGEVKINGRDSSGVIQSYAFIKADGTIELNGNTDFAVSYNELLTILSQLATDLNTNLTDIKTAITGLGGSYVPTPITIDLTPAKISTVKIASP